MEGQDSPSTGQDSPIVGQDSPNTGQNSPNASQDSPNTGLDIKRKPIETDSVPIKTINTMQSRGYDSVVQSMGKSQYKSLSRREKWEICEKCNVNFLFKISRGSLGQSVGNSPVAMQVKKFTKKLICIKLIRQRIIKP